MKRNLTRPNSADLLAEIRGIRTFLHSAHGSLRSAQAVIAEQITRVDEAYARLGEAEAALERFVAEIADVKS